MPLRWATQREIVRGIPLTPRILPGHDESSSLSKETHMVRYVLLLNWTDQGVRNVDKTLERVAATRKAFAKTGAKLNELLWCLGPYDMIAQAEAPDDETMTALSVGLAKLGNVRTITCRVFDEEAMKTILGKV
jgi:uncharacterized protein with GYD domain